MYLLSSIGWSYPLWGRIFSWIFGTTNQSIAAVPTKQLTITPESAELITNLFLTALEKKSKNDSNTLVISGASITKAASYIETIGIQLFNNDKPIKVRGKTPRRPQGFVFKRFLWDDAKVEDQQRAAAVNHLQTQLTKFGIHENFQIYDLHSDHTCLSFEDEKSGKISGGTDMIIAPRGLVTEFAVTQSCVVVELKTKKNVEANGLESFRAEGVLELIAANYHSNQMALVIVTDLFSRAYGWTFQRNGDGVGIIQYSDLSLAEMASLMVNHLEANCFPDRSFQLKRALEKPELRDKEAVQIQSMFKKARVSECDLALEHFHELLELTEEGSRERAQVIQEFLWSQGMPSSNYLRSMLK